MGYPGPGIRLEPRGSAELKGFVGAVELVEAVLHEVTLPSVHRPADPGPLPPELDDDTPIVGREHELRWLRGTWRQARRGRGRVLLVSGSSGTGKTRLAAGLAAWVRGEGGTVRYSGAGGTAVADALTALGDARVAERPTLFVLDALDLFDEVVQALGAALGQLAQRPVLVLGLVRSTTERPALEELVGRVDSRGDGHRRLGALALDDVRDLLRLYAGDAAVDAPVEQVLRTSGGLPAKVHEMAREWARDEASRRLAAAAEWLAEGRTRQAADLEFANTVIGLKLDRISRGGASVAPEGACPYKGLAGFEESDAEYFFGRERLVGELAARTVGFGLLGLAGPSGSGKSSVVMAGLLPSLAAGLLPGSERWRQARMRPGEHPVQGLDAAVDDGARERLVLAIDQFEELFTSTSDEDERRAFLDRLVALARDPERAVVIATIRADFMGHCARYREFAEALATNLVLVGTMTPDELRRAIELPARRTGLRVESSLTEALLVDVADEPGALPLLSTALVELWQARSDGWLRRDSYERTGGVRGAVARLAEESFARLEGPQREAARAVLLRLVQGEGDTLARRRVPVAEFEPHRDPTRAAALARFTEDRLLTTSDGAVEVAHEALLTEWPRLREWLAEDAQGRQLRLHLTEASKQWDHAGRESGELYRGARLSATLDWSTLHGRELNDLERQFLNASSEASEREAQRQRRTNRRLRGLLVGVAAFLVIALVAGSLALVQRGQARRSAEQARAQSVRARRAAIDALSQRLGAQALDQRDLQLSLLLAREGVAIHDSVQTRGYLLSALERSPDAVRVFRPLPGRYQAVFATPDGGEFLVGPTNEEGWALVQAGTGRVLRRGTGGLLVRAAGPVRAGQPLLRRRLVARPPDPRGAVEPRRHAEHAFEHVCGRFADGARDRAAALAPRPERREGGAVQPRRAVSGHRRRFAVADPVHHPLAIRALRPSRQGPGPPVYGRLDPSGGDQPRRPPRRRGRERWLDHRVRPAGPEWPRTRVQRAAQRRGQRACVRSRRPHAGVRGSRPAGPGLGCGERRDGADAGRAQRERERTVAHLRWPDGLQ